VPLFFGYINRDMTAINSKPANPNFLHPNKFQLNFSRLPDMQYFCQSVSVPGISMSEVPQTTPFVDLYRPGEKAIYDLLNVTFMIDEELKSWLGIHDWIRGMTFPTDFKEYQNLGLLSKTAGIRQAVGLQPQYSDASITILSSANNPTYKFTFYEVFPTTLSTFVMSSSDTPDTIMTADATFRYSYFNVDKLN
jgi:hypothetical protein